LDDDLEAVFNRACISNDVEAAMDLLSLMENWHERRETSYGGERRINDDALQRARRALERLVVLHGAPSVCLKAEFAKTSGAKERLTEMSEFTDVIPSNNLLPNPPPECTTNSTASNLRDLRRPLMASNN
jgi:hypothetical protein